MKLKMFDKDQPLGLTKGSIRALIALAFTIATVYSIVTGIDIRDTLLPIATMIIGYYFGTRS